MEDADGTLSTDDVMGLLVLLVFIVAVGLLGWLFGSTLIADKEARIYCIESGFPELVLDRRFIGPSHYYCLKRENGSDVMREVPR